MKEVHVKSSLFVSVWQDIFDNNVKCSVAHRSESACTEIKGTFFDSISYFQLQQPKHYKDMCRTLEQKFFQDADTEKEVVLYLAIPPSVFQSAVKNFRTQCTFSGQSVSLKVSYKFVVINLLD
jgi:glucose-6-phosphate 1-dehydrogenase